MRKSFIENCPVKSKYKDQERGVQNGPITKNVVLFSNCFILQELKLTIIVSWLCILITQMSIFILFVSNWVLFECVFPESILNGVLLRKLSMDLKLSKGAIS